MYFPKLKIKSKVKIKMKGVKDTNSQKQMKMKVKIIRRNIKRRRIISTNTIIENRTHLLKQIGLVVQPRVKCLLSQANFREVFKQKIQLEKQIFKEIKHLPFKTNKTKIFLKLKVIISLNII